LCGAWFRAQVSIYALLSPRGLSVVLPTLPSVHIFGSIHHGERELQRFLTRPSWRKYDWQHQRRHTMGDKGGKKDKDKDKKQKAIKQAKDLKEKKDKQPKALK
jgi:hypothetical protein